MNINIVTFSAIEKVGGRLRWLSIMSRGVSCALAIAVLCTGSLAVAQTASAVRSLAGGVAPLFRLPGGSLYIDNQGTQGFLYTPGQHFQSYSFRNPTTGQAWSGAVMTFGPQLSIGLIQGANQVGTPTVLPPPPRETSPLAEIQPMAEIQPTLLDEIP